MVSALSVWPPRIAALVLSTAAALGVAYWGLHWRLPSSPVLSATVASSGDQPVDSDAVAKALGAAAKELAAPALPAPESSRFVLLGVLGNARAGSALIAVDGKSPKPVRVGHAVLEGWTLRLVEGRRAVLSRNGTDLELALPPLPQPATVSKKVP